MALEKKIITNTGLSANYWIVARVELDKIAKQGLITMYGYLNEAHRRSEQGFLDRRYINIYPKDFGRVFALNRLDEENPYAIAYELVKETDTFRAAKDILGPGSWIASERG